MAINEQKVTGRKFRKLVDEAQKLWQRISFWTAACDVEFEDGKTAEQKIGKFSFELIDESVYNSKTHETNCVYFIK